MIKGRFVVTVGAWLLLGTGCVTLAPGANQVKVTKNPQDVAACKAVGNIQVPTTAGGTVDMANAANQFRNQVVGLGGNTGLVTAGLVGVPSQGIAYQCP